MKDKLAKGVMWLSAAKAVINLLALFSTLILARLLVPEDFGLVSLANTMLLIVSAVTELSLASALIHHKDPHDIHFHTAWTLNLLRAMAIGLAFSMFGPVAARIFHEPRLTEVMIALGISISLAGFNNPKTVIYTRNLIFWQEFALTVTQKLTGFIVGVTLALLYKNYWALIGGTLASQFVGVVVSYVILPFKPKLSFRHAKELWSFSIWLTLGKFVTTANGKLDHLLIGGYVGTRALGFYTVGDNLGGMVTRESIGPLETVLFPGFRWIEGDNVRLKAAYRSAQTLIAAIALPIGVGCALVAHSLVLLSMGAQWMPVAQVMQVLACIFALQTLSSAVHPLAMAKGETRLLFHRDLLSFLVRVPCISLGMFFGGFFGLIYAGAAAGVVGVFINMRLVRRLIGTSVTEQILANSRSLISLCVMSVGVLLLEYAIGRDGAPIELALKIAAFVIAGAALYLTSHLILWISAGKPAGPEREVSRMVARLFGKLLKLETGSMDVQK